MKLNNIQKRIFYWELIILIIVLLCFLAHSAIKNKINAAAHIRNTNKFIAFQINNRLVDFKKKLRIISEMKIISENLQNFKVFDDEKNITVLNTIKSLTGASVIYILDNQGTVIASTKLNDQRSITKENFKFRPYFTEAMKGDEVIYPAYGVTTKERGIYFSVPVYSVDKKIILGVAVIKFSVKHIDSLLNAVNVTSGLISDDGVIFACNRKEWIFKIGYKITEEKKSRIIASKQFNNNEFKQLNILLTKYLFPALNETCYFHITPIIMNGWSIFTFQENSVFFLTSKNFIFIFVYVLFSIFFILLTILIHKRFEAKRDSADLLRRISVEKERLNTLINSIPVLICFKGCSGEWLKANAALLNFLGIENINYYGKTSLQLSKYVKNSYKILLESAEAEDEKAWMTGKVVNETVKYNFDNENSDSIFSATWIPLFNKDGSRKGLIFIARDITEILEYEKEQKKTEQIYSLVPSAIYTVDNNKIIRSWNKKAEDITGYTADEVIGNVCYQFALDPCLKKCGLLSTDLKKPVYNRECKIKTKSGDIRTISKNIGVIYNEKKEIIGGIESFDDITDRKILEEKLLNEKIKAETANRTKTEFLANISHEIRTPLNAILGFSEILLNDDSIQHVHRESVNLIYTSGSSLLSLLNDILDLSKIEADKLMLESIDFDISLIAEEIVKVSASRAKSKNLNFTKSIEKPKYQVIGDPTRIRQIILNLVSNSIKFTSTGQVGLMLRIISESSESISIEIIISDTGIGIPESKFTEIFEPFSQVDGSTTRKYGGTGLGLAIVKKLVKLMNGEITICSEVNKYTEFKITLPFKKSTEKISENEVTQPRGIQEKIKKINIDSIKILVVEDNKINIKLIRALFSKFRINLDIAENGLDGYEKIITSNYNIVFMDIHMPVMDGITATKKVRQNGNMTPIIALTADAMKGVREKFIEAGMNDYISKPIKINDILDMIIKWQSSISLNSDNNISINKKSQNKGEDSMCGDGDNEAGEKMIKRWLTIMEGDKDLEEVVYCAIKELPENIRTLENFLISKNIQDIQRSAHSLKGSTGSVGMSELYELFLQMDTEAKKGTSCNFAVIAGILDSVKAIVAKIPKKYL